MQYQTNTNLAIDSAVSEYAASSRPVTKNIVVITDGLSNDPTATQNSAQAAIAAGIRLFAVGIGPSANYQELLGITGYDPSRVYTASSFDQLTPSLFPLTSAICN